MRILNCGHNLSNLIMPTSPNVMRVIPIPKPPLRLFVPVCFVESLNISGSVFGDEPQNNQMKWKCVIYAINKTVKGNRGSRCVSKETLSTVIKRDFIQERCEINKIDILYELYASLRWYDRAIDIHPMRTLCRIRGLYQRDLTATHYEWCDVSMAFLHSNTRPLPLKLTMMIDPEAIKGTDRDKTTVKTD